MNLQLRHLFASRFREEAGFTLVEILVASLLLTTGLALSIGAIESAKNAENVVERSQSAVNLAQRELEKITNSSYNELALTETPSASGDSTSPLSRVNGNLFRADTGTNEMMVISDSGSVSPGPETVKEGNVTAQVYRFVTWVDAPDYPGCTIYCASAQDYKRVTVAVRVSQGANRGFKKAVFLSTLRINPNFGPAGEVTQPDDPNPTQAHDNFHLYDTPHTACSGSTYSQPGGDHAVHATDGSCDGSNPPDLMGLDAPPNPSEPATLPLYTYSSDLAGDYSGGIALKRSSTDCSESGQDKYSAHSWSTKPFSLPYQLTGKMSLDFWTAAIGGASGQGKLCIWIYDRYVSGGSATDTLITAYSYSLNTWPTELTNLSVTFSHTAYTLATSHSLRMMITVSNASDNDLQLIYDHPDSPTFLQVRTTTPISQ